MIELIRGSQNTQEAKLHLTEQFALSEIQAQAIVDMRLRTLTGLERGKLESEYEELMKRIGELKAILSDENLLLGVIRTEMTAIADKYGDARRTAIGHDESDLIHRRSDSVGKCCDFHDKTWVYQEDDGDNFKSQHRGGKGIKGMQILEDALHRGSSDDDEPTTI